jgi:hypothetical protein
VIGGGVLRSADTARKLFPLPWDTPSKFVGENVTIQERAQMDKGRRGLSTKKPPEPSDSHAEIAAWIKQQMPDLQLIVNGLDQMIRSELSEPHYALKWKKAYYGTPELGWVIEMVAYDVSVNVVFLGGADFDSPPPLGDTDRSRYVKVKTMEEVEDSDMAKWIENAGQVDGWK